MQTHHKRLTGIALAVLFLLSIPLIAMQFTDEVNWSPADFGIMGVLLLGTGLLCELTLRRVRTLARRVAVCGALLAALILIWLELAVGLFGSPFAGS